MVLALDRDHVGVEAEASGDHPSDRRRRGGASLHTAADVGSDDAAERGLEEGAHLLVGSQAMGSPGVYPLEVVDDAEARRCDIGDGIGFGAVCNASNVACPCRLPDGARSRENHALNALGEGGQVVRRKGGAPRPPDQDHALGADFFADRFQVGDMSLDGVPGHVVKAAR